MANIIWTIGMSVDGTVPEDSLEQMQIALGNILQNLTSANMRIHDLTKLVFILSEKMTLIGEDRS